jgi:ribosomal protein RSM22 (predicted rRNA methylase)
MRLPDELGHAIEAAVAGTPGAALTRASAALTDAYRSGAAASPALATAEQRLAYLAVRAPATFAATARALGALADRIGDAEIRSVLDLGAGPGTAMWAATEIFPDVERVTLVERDRELAALGRRLASSSSHPALAAAVWSAGDVSRNGPFEPHDLVVASYVVGELDDRALVRAVDAAFAAADAFVVVVEPGTTRGFERVLAARARLVELGGRVVAPCPHDRACPMEGHDWCHFAARVERTSLHRRVKAAAMGHEDEKYSYVAVTKRTGDPATARVVRHPLRRAGHTYLDLCGPAGLERVVVSKHDRDAYRRVRKTDWGDEWGR